MRQASADLKKAFLEEEEDVSPPLADCDFANTFKSIVIMPQGWLPERRSTWTLEKLDKIEKLTRNVIRRFRGDPERVSLTGQSAGGRGAWRFASMRPRLWASVSMACMPASPVMVTKLEGLHMWIIGWTGDGMRGNDAMVAALKARSSGTVRYTRYVRAPSPPDPMFRFLKNHASYDLIYRDHLFWKWVLDHRKPEAA